MAATPKAQLAAFIARYSPEMQAQFREARSRLRALFPRGFELVYDNYNALVVGYSPTERASQAIVSIAGYPRWVTLFFLDGAKLPDPSGRLQGSGSRVRNVRLAPPSTLEEDDVLELLSQAIAPHGPAFEAAPKLRTIVKSVSAKQRPRVPSR